MLRALSRLEVLLGILLIVLSALFHANSYLCYTENCGGLIGGMATFYGLLFGACLIIAGLSRDKGIAWYAVAHIPIVYSIYLATTIV